MKKPQAENEKLKNIINQLWTKRSNAIGDGSMADAIRNELKTGEPTRGAFHSQKGQGFIIRLRKWMEETPRREKGADDNKIARAIIKDIENALKGK